MVFPLRAQELAFHDAKPRKVPGDPESVPALFMGPPPLGPQSCR